MSKEESNDSGLSTNEAGTDPLRRITDSNKTPSFFRGFFNAQHRRPIVEIEPSFGSMVFGGMLAAAPMWLIYYFLYKQRVGQIAGNAASKAASASGGAPNKKGFMGMMDQAMMQRNPLQNRDFRVEIKNTNFKDVIGIPEAVTEVKQYVDFLKQPDRFTRLGARIPKGCLLTGEPGTGKTLLAKAVAGEADVPFFSCSGADFMEVYVGSGPRRVRDLFGEAKKVAPSIIFVDEIDAIGSRSDGRSGNVSGEENRTINQLLAELDGLSSMNQDAAPIVVFAATNLMDNLDKALLREGRFDRKVEVAMPDREAREDLFAHYLKKVVTGDPDGKQPEKPKETKKEGDDKKETITDGKEDTSSKDIITSTAQIPVADNREIAKSLAALTPGVSPASIAAIVNEAALGAAISQEPCVNKKTLREAIDNVLIGKKHRNRMKEDASRRVALHEAGHTLVAWMQPGETDVIKVSITPRGRAGGFTQQLGRETLDMITDKMLFSQICVMLGGRLAENTMHGDLTTGAHDDLQRATKSAIQQFLVLGMSDSVGLLAHDHNRLDGGNMYQKYSERLQAKAEREAQRLVEAAKICTEKIIEENREKLMATTDALFEKKELLKEDLEGILGRREPVDATKMHPIALEAIERFGREAIQAGGSESLRKKLEKERGADLLAKDQGAKKPPLSTFTEQEEPKKGGSEVSMA